MQWLIILNIAFKIFDCKTKKNKPNASECLGSCERQIQFWAPWKPKQKKHHDELEYRILLLFSLKKF